MLNLTGGSTKLYRRLHKKTTAIATSTYHKCRHYARTEAVIIIMRVFLERLSM